MKKNKTIAYMLAATLLVGGTFMGTKALFNDVEEVAGELKISTGDVDIKIIDKQSKWSVVRNGIEHKHSSNVSDDNGNDLGEPGDLSDEEKDNIEAKAFVNNLKPGDIIRKTVKVKNVGTLVATNITVTNELKDTDLIDYKEAGITADTLLPGDEATVSLELEIKNVGGQHEDENGFNTTKQEDSVINLTNAWKLTASQQNTRQDLSK